MRHEAVSTRPGMISSPLDARDDISIDLSAAQRRSSRIAAMPALVIPAALEAQRAVLEELDAEARQIVEVMMAELQDDEPEVDVVGMLERRVSRYTRNGQLWLADRNRDLAIMLQTDPRLAAIETLYAGAEGAVITAKRDGETVRDRRMAIHTYATLLRGEGV